MSNPFEKQENTNESLLHADFDLMDFRAGHWPGSKTPPWLLNEMWVASHNDWKEAAKKIDWESRTEILFGKGTINERDAEIDIYAIKDSRSGSQGFYFAAYPKEKSYKDFWDEDGNEKYDEDED